MKYLSEMENVLGILTNYKKRGIRISLDATGENLTIKGELSGLSDLDKVELRSSKELLISFLRSQKNVMLTRTALNMDERVALSPGQKGIWLHSHIEENDTMYLIPSVYDLVVPGLNEADLLSASEIFAGAHPILACVFGEKDGLPYQQLAEFTAANHLFFEDLSHFSASEQEAQSAEYIHRAMQQGFDLSKQAPWSITVMDLGENHYRFFVKIHHLIADGATLGLLVEGLVEAYGLQRKGLTYHYDGAHHHDFVGWISDKTHQQRSSDFWKSYLEHYPEDLQLSSMGRIEDSVSATAVEQSLPTFIRDRVAHFSSSHSLPLSQLFTFSFGLVLSKHGRQNDVIIGTPVEGRTQADLQKMLGDLVNTVPVRLALNYEKSALENLQIFGKGYLNVLEHQQYPFEYILDDIGYQRQADRFPLFNTMISFPNNQELGSKNENELKIAKEQALYDLTLSVIELTDSTELQLEFDRKKYTFEYASSILAQTLIVLDQVVSSAQTVLSEISLLAESERKAHLYKGLPKSITNPSHSTVVEIITQMISKHPHALAVVEAETSYNYAALQLKSQAIAWTLEQHGLKSGDRVLVELPSGLDLLSSMLGIWQMGGVYVPIGTELPSKRKEEILEDSGAVITIDADFISGLSQTTDQRVELSREHLAYILYTSGSTGKPKGVAVSHGALLNKMLEEAALLKTTNLTTLTLTSPTFDVSLLELVLPLTVGGTVIVQQDKSNSSVFQSILQNKVNVLQGTPTYFSHLETELDESTSLSLNETLELLCIGGESLNNALVKRLKRKLPNVRINNHYGPTEITIDALVKQDLDEFKQNSLGKPFGNTGAIIVDDYNNVLPENIQGELLITGPSLATAYWNNELETESKFPNVHKLGTRVYRTGDLAAWSKEGEIHFIGRKDKQIKYRGYRIELEEINARLREIDGISDAFTSVTSNVLVSWIVMEGVDETLLREYLQQTLPEYMIPTVYEKVTSIPMNANGKVDEKQLPPPRSLKAEYVAPRNELEEQLAEIWQEVLGVERVGIYDNFFELGGHSLKLTQLVSRYLHVFEVELTIKELFLNPSLIAHSKLIANPSSNSREINIEPIAESDDYPVSYAQQRMWILSQLEGGSRAYHMPTSMRLKGKLEVELFIKSIEIIIDKHESLRTVFITNENGDLRQKIVSREELGFKVDQQNLIDSTKDEQDASVESYVTNQTEALFDLSRGPLIRVGILQLNPEEFIFCYNMHHIISDGWSMEVLAKDVLLGYNSLLNDRKVEIKLPFQYKDYASWQLNQIEGDRGLKSKEFWSRQFRGELPVLDLPSQKLRPAIKTYHGASIDFTFTKELTRHLKRFCQKEGGTLFMGLLAALKGIFYRYTNQEDIIIGTPIAGRRLLELENQIGLYVNTLALRTKFTREDTFSQLFNRVKETILGAYDHQDYPFDKLVNELDLPRDSSRNPLFDVMLVMQNISKEENSLSPFNLDEHKEILNERVDNTVSRFDISFTFLESNGIINGLVEYNSDIYTLDFISQLIIHYQAFIEIALKLENSSISEFIYMGRDEIRRILYSFNDTKVDFPNDNTIIDLFEEQVRKTPNNIAIVFEDKELTYNDLNEKSNQLGHYLRKEYRISPDDLITVKLNRSEGIIVALLGILKSGAAYVPIDTNYPEERINYIIQDCKSKLTLDSKEFELFYNRREDFSKLNLDKENAPIDLAYMIYTSGTTGNPKGVMIEHKSAVEMINWSLKEFDASKFDVLYSGTSYCFDLSVFEYFYPLALGKKIRLLNTIFDLKDYAHKDKSILLNTVPSVIRKLQEEQVSLENVGILNMAGEAMTVDVINKIPLDKIQVYNLYGPSEDTTYSTFYHVQNTNSSNIPIGRPISNTQIYILDEGKNHVPIGVTGKIFISGTGLARAYWNNPELTEEKFLANPFDEGSRMYHTGDLGRWLPDGNIEFLGRDDNQVKIRGFRIELGEIEMAIAQYSHLIKQAIAQVIDKDNEKLLIAYFVSEIEIDKSDLKRFLLDKLPEFVVPNYYVELDEIPLNSNGKVDYKSLPKFSDDDVIRKEFKPAESTQEIKLSLIWQEVLGLKTVGVLDNFFELGGNSFKLIKLIVEIEREFNKKIGFADVFANADFLALLQVIESTQKRQTKIEKVELQNDYPVTKSQERIWVASQDREGSIAHNITTSLLISGELIISKLIWAYNQILERHEILRTAVFSLDDGELRQRVLDVNSIDFNLQILDLKDKNWKEDSEEVKELVAEKKRHVFDISKGKVLEVTLLQLSQEKTIWTQAIHHIAADEWSISVLFDELIQLYVNDSIDDQEVKISASSIQYKDYVSWERKALISNPQLEEFWDEKFAKRLPRLNLKPDFTPEVSSYEGGEHIIEIENDDSKVLKKYLREKQLSNSVFFTSLMYILFSKYTGNSDFIIGLISSQRENKQLENQLGPYLNLLPLRLSYQAELQFPELLREIKTEVIGAINASLFPFEYIKEKIQPKSSAKLDLVLNVMNNVRIDSDLTNNDLGNIRISAYKSDEIISKFPICVYIFESETKFQIKIEYQTAIFKHAKIELFGELFVKAIHQLNTISTQTIDAIHLFDEINESEIIKTEREVNAKDQTFPASYHQERLWFIDNFENGQLYENAPVYHNLPLVLYVKGILDSEKIKRSLDFIVERHDALRTRIELEDQRIMQIVGKESVYKFTQHLRKNALPNDDATIELYKKIINQPFSISEQGLFRVDWIKLSEVNSILLFVVHHIIGDRKSLELIVKEFSCYYNSLDKNQVIDFPEPQIQYADFSNFQRNISGLTIEKLMFYWQKQLNFIAPLTFHSDNIRDHIHVFEAGILSLELDPIDQKLMPSVKDNKFGIFFTAFQILMHKYSGLSNIVIGTNYENRTSEKLTSVIGPISNLIVLNTTLDNKDRLMDTILDNELNYQQSVKHGLMPFDKLVTVLNPKKDMSRTALFDVMFNYEDHSNDQISEAIDECSCEIIETNLGLGKYDFNLLIIKKNSGYTAHLTYNKLYYNTETAQRLLDHYSTLLNNFTNEQAIVSELEYVPEAESIEIISLLDKSNSAWPTNETLVSIIEKQALKHASRTAVIIDEREFTYEELNLLANQFSDFLTKKHKVKSKDFVALLLPRNESQIISILAVLKCNAAYVPIDIEYPEERIKFIMNDCSAKVCINEDLFNEFLSTKEQFVASNPTIHHAPNDLVYLIYTSGSTGQPKAVMIENRNVVRLFLNDSSLFDFDENDRWTMFHSYCFDFSVWEIYGALLFGGSVVIIAKMTAIDPPKFLRLLREKEVTVLSQTPSAFYNLISIEPWKTVDQLALRYVVFGGEMLHPKKLATWHEFYPKVKLINMYGITETTVHVTFKEITQSEIDSNKSSIGLPIPTLSCVVLDSDGRIVPKLIPGELWVAGEGLARGYLNQEKLTSEKFISNPYGAGRLYSSGDVVRIMSNNELEYIGRKDNQVKIRGFRIELGEIEKALLKIERISEALVRVWKNEQDENELVAYFTSHEPVDITTLKSELKTKIPFYMIPSFFVPVARFELNNNGKIDTSVLPAIDHNDVHGKPRYEAPRNATEKKLVEIWEEIVGSHTVGIHDDFFDLGGNSLKIIAVINKIEHIFSVRIDVKDFFHYSKLLQLAEQIDKNKVKADSDELIPLAKQDYYEITSTQFGIWFECQKGVELLKSYNMVYGISISGTLEASTVHSSFQKLTNRHEILRTTFAIEDIGIVQKIGKENGLNFSIEEVEIEMDVVPQYIESVVEKEKDRLFDLDDGPLVIFRYIVINKEQSILLFNAHHVVCDGVSVKIIIDDFFDFYKNSLSDPAYAKPKLEVQFKDYAHWINAKIEKNETDYQNYWLEQLTPIHKQSFQSKSNSELANTNKGKRISFRSSEEVTQQIKAYVQRKNITEYMYFSAVSALLIGQWLEISKVILLSPFSVRPNISFENQIGLYLNTIPIAISINEDTSFDLLIDNVKETVLNNFNNYYFPLAKLIETLMENGENVEDNFNVMLTLQNQDMGFKTLGSSIDFDISEIVSKPQSYTKFDLTFNVLIDAFVNVELEYNESLFTEKQIELLLNKYIELLIAHTN